MSEYAYKSEFEHPGWRVFNELIDVRIPKLFSRSISDISRFGTYTTTDPEYDRELENESVRTTRTIYQLAELSEMGSEIILENPNDSVRIYNLIMEYTKLWSSSVEKIGLVQNLDQYMQTETYINQQKDIELFLAFAETIHPHATTRLPAIFDTNSLAGKFKLLQQRLSKITPSTSAPAPLPADAATGLAATTAERIKRRRLW